MSSTPSMDQVLNDMLEALKEYLPQSSVSIVSLKERSLALGNSRGMQRLASFDAVELKGGRLEVVIRYLLTGSNPDALDTEMAALHGRLLAAKDELWTAGVLRFAAEETSPSEHVPDLNAWRKTADYHVLYEFHYNDAGGAESLITRIPISIDSLNQCPFHSRQDLTYKPSCLFSAPKPIPSAKCNQTPCKNCDFQAICGFSS